MSPHKFMASPPRKNNLYASWRDCDTCHIRPTHVQHVCRPSSCSAARESRITTYALPSAVADSLPRADGAIGKQ